MGCCSSLPSCGLLGLGPSGAQLLAEGSKGAEGDMNCKGD